MQQLTTGENKRGRGHKNKRSKAKKTQVKTPKKETRKGKMKREMFANKEIEEDDMGKGLWLLKIFKKSKQKKFTVAKMLRNIEKRYKISKMTVAKMHNSA